MQTQLHTQENEIHQEKTNLLSQFDESFLFKNALILVDHGDYDLALNLFDTILNENENHTESLKWSGYCHSQNGNTAKAIEAFFRLVELRPTEDNLFYLAESFYVAGQDALAQEYYEQALKEIDYESPHLFQIYKKLGNISVKSKDFDSAEEFYNKAFTIIQNSDDLYVNYGTLELQRGNHNAALERFQKALELNIKNDKAWCGLAMIYRLRGDFELSWGDLQQSLEINPDNIVALKLCVDWGLLEKDYDFSIQALEKFLARSKTPQIDWTYTYAGLLYHSGDWQECQKVINIILQYNPDYQPARDLQKRIIEKQNL